MKQLTAQNHDFQQRQGNQYQLDNQREWEHNNSSTDTASQNDEEDPLADHWFSGWCLLEVTYVNLIFTRTLFINILRFIKQYFLITQRFYKDFNIFLMCMEKFHSFSTYLIISYLR